MSITDPFVRRPIMTTLVMASILGFGLLAYFSGKVGVWLNTRPSRGLWLDRLAGTVFLGLGARMLASR